MNWAKNYRVRAVFADEVKIRDFRRGQNSTFWLNFDFSGQVTKEKPLKNDFVKVCEEYLEKLKIDLTFSEIELMSKRKFKKLVKEKVNKLAFDYLIAEKNKQEKV